MTGGLNVPNVNAVTVTANSSGFSIAGGSSSSKTLTVSNGVTIAGTDGSTLNIGTGGTLLSGAFQASSQGTTGAQGVQGTTGSQGAQGTDGVQGNTGAQGTQGLTGPNGIQGATGTQGSTGTQGATGVQGSTGAQGIQGITGSQGATGTQGAVGSTGGTGATGSTGVQGSTGAQGTSGTSILGTNNTWSGTNAFTYPSGTAIISLDSTASLGTGTGLSLAWRSYSNSGNSILATTAAMRGARENSTSGNYAGLFSIYTTDSGGSNLERFHINSSGNVGIGNTAPTSLLALSSGSGAGSDATSTGTLQIRQASTGLANGGGLEFHASTFGSGYGFKWSAIDSSGVHLVLGSRENSATWTERLRITSAGNVGIGTASPANRLSVAGSGTSLFHFLGEGNTYYVLRSRNSADSAFADLVLRTDDFVIETGTSGAVTERLRLGDTGNFNIDSGTFFVDALNDRVGIGTTSPGARLTVSGSASDTVATFTRTGGANCYITMTSGASSDYTYEMATERTGASTGNFYFGGNHSTTFKWRQGGYAQLMNLDTGGLTVTGAITNTNTTTSTSSYTSNSLAFIAGSAASSATYIASSISASHSGASGANLSGSLIGLRVTAAENWGSTTNAFAIQSQLTNTLNFQTITNGYNFHANSPSIVANSYLTNAYGLYIAQQKVTGVTTGYGIYQENSADVNYFNGTVGIGALPGSNAKLTLTGAIGINSTSFTADASLHIATIYGGNGRLTQMHPTGNSLNALNLMASTNGSGTHQWWSWGVNANQWTINPGTSFGTGFTINSSGNVGIGTSSPGAKLDVDTVGTAGVGFIAKASSISSSQVNIGVSVVTAGRPFIGTNTSTNPLEIGTRASVDMLFLTDTTERARITSGGNLLVGTTSSFSTWRMTVESSANDSIGAVVNNTSAFPFVSWNKATSGDNIFAGFFTEGTITFRGTISYNRGAGLVAYNTTSDYRSKDILGAFVNSGAVIDSVPVYIGKMKDATLERPMFIAHETPAYAHTGEKDAVDAEGKPIYQQMDASTLVPVLWAELQSVRARLAALESK
jgi:hypothetical protein